MRLSLLTALLGYGVALLGALPLLPHLPAPPRLLFAAGLIAGLLAERRGRPLLPHRLLTVVTTLLFLWYAVQLRIHNPLLPVASILLILLATRLAAEKNPRTWLQSHTIALFCLSASSLFDLGPRFLLLLGLMLPLIALGLVLLTFQNAGAPATLERSALRQAVALGLLIPLASLLLTPLFFPILPRTQRPLWNLYQQSGAQGSGLSDTVRPGASAQTPDSGPTAFRAELPRRPANELYWRGFSFSSLEGLNWKRDSAGLPPASRAAGTVIQQTITLEPGGGRNLIGLDLPLEFRHIAGAAIPQATWNRPLPSSRRLRYEVESATGGLMLTTQPDRRLLTRLPPETPTALRQLAQRLAAAAPDEPQRLVALENWFRGANFRYSRSDLPTGERALEQFLFERRSGNCEFFASAYALLARAMGLPARLVGGYYGGEYNELGGYYRVGEERAHVWVELWQERSGWLRVDPSSFAVNSAAALGERRERPLLLRLRQTMDSLDHTWNTAVISYDFERQFAAAGRLQSRLSGMRLPDAATLARAAVATGLALALFATGLRLWRNGYFNRNQRLLAALRRSVERRHGIPRHEPLGLFDLAERCNDPLVRAFALLYGGALYRDRPLDAADYHRLRALLRQLRR